MENNQENRYVTKPNLNTYLKFETVISVFLSIIFFFSIYFFLNVIDVSLSLNQVVLLFIFIIFLAFLQPVISFFKLRKKEYVFKSDRILFLPNKKIVYYENINDVHFKKKFSDVGDIIINTPVGNQKLEKVYHAKKVSDYLKSLIN